MDFIIYSAGLLVVLALGFFAIERPYIVATILVFCFVYRFNIELPGPFDARGILTIFLFFRLVLFDKQNFTIMKKYLFHDLNWILLVLFLLINFYTTFTLYGRLRGQIQLFALLIINSILGFIIIINGQGKKVFLWGVVTAAVFTTIDIMWSTMVFGSLQIRSLFKSVLLHESFSEYNAYNHNPLGLVCGYGLLLIFLSFIKKQTPRIISLSLIFITILGILISTSRSTLIALIIVFTIIFIVQTEIKFNLNKVLIGFIGTALFFVSFYFIYNIILSSGQYKSEFVDQTYYRLYEEPMSLVEGNKAKVFKSGKLVEGNSRVRMERATKGLLKFTRLDLETQLFGIGQGGYLENNFGDDYGEVKFNAHNGYILLLVERGLIGFLIFILVIISLSFKSFSLLKRRFIDFPLIYVFLALVIFATGQNGELTDSLAFMFLGAIIANTKEYLVHNDIMKSTKLSAIGETEYKNSKKKSYKIPNIPLIR